MQTRQTNGTNVKLARVGSESQSNTLAFQLFNLFQWLILVTGQSPSSWARQEFVHIIHLPAHLLNYLAFHYSAHQSSCTFLQTQCSSCLCSFAFTALAAWALFSFACIYSSKKKKKNTATASFFRSISSKSYSLPIPECLNIVTQQFNVLPTYVSLSGLKTHWGLGTVFHSYLEPQ